MHVWFGTKPTGHKCTSLQLARVWSTPASSTLCRPPPRTLVTGAVPHVRTGWTKVICRSTLALSPSWPFVLSPTPPGACAARAQPDGGQCNGMGVPFTAPHAHRHSVLLNTRGFWKTPILPKTSDQFPCKKKTSQSLAPTECHSIEN